MAVIDIRKLVANSNDVTFSDAVDSLSYLQLFYIYMFSSISCLIIYRKTKTKEKKGLNNWNNVATRRWEILKIMFIRLDRIHERDGQTNIARRHRPRLCIASRGKTDLHQGSVTLPTKLLCIWFRCFSDFSSKRYAAAYFYINLHSINDAANRPSLQDNPVDRATHVTLIAHASCHCCCECEK